MSLELLVVLTIVCWGIWGIFDKLALERSSHQDVLLMLYLLFLPQIPLIWLVSNAVIPGWHLSLELMQWTGLAALCYTVAMVAYLTALSKAEASYVLGITAGYPLILQFFAVWFLGEQLVASRLLGAALIGLGVCAIGTTSDRQQQQLASRDKLGMVAGVVVATLCWGIWGIFDKKAVAIAHPLTVYLGQCLWDIVAIVALFLFFRAQGHRPRLKSARSWRFCLLSATTLMLGALTYLSAMSISTASYVIVITGCYPLLMYLFALLLLKERFNRLRLSGIALVVAGGALVQLTSSM